MHTVYTARPRPSHCLPENPKPTPTMSMAEYAKRENKAANRDQQYKPGYNQDRESLGRMIYEYVRDNPRCYTAHVVKVLGRKPRTIYNAIADARLYAARDGYTWHSKDEYHGGRSPSDTIGWRRRNDRVRLARRRQGLLHRMAPQ